MRQLQTQAPHPTHPLQHLLYLEVEGSCGQPLTQHCRPKYFPLFSLLVEGHFVFTYSKEENVSCMWPHQDIWGYFYDRLNLTREN